MLLPGASRRTLLLVERHGLMEVIRLALGQDLRLELYLPCSNG